MTESAGERPRSGVSTVDLKAGFLVFLIALPLSLGIAMASGFPPVAGVLTAIVGGLVVSFLGSARLTIKGPAAGLIVIALGAVQELGQGDLHAGYRRALAVGVMAACVQLGIALAGLASTGVAMSPSVVHGMLAAIGVIIISKQVHTALGVVPHAKEPLELLAEIPRSLMAANPEILLIGALALVILFGMPLIRRRWASLVPAPVVVILVAIPLGLVFDLQHTHSYTLWTGMHEVGPDLLVDLPGNLLEAVTFPDFSMALSLTSLKYVLMYALVGTIESTLSVIAVDSMDPDRQTSDLDRDLRAVALGNLASAAIGGLPMISEIVRSKANVDAGARSYWANWIHGACLLAFVALVPGFLEQIPLAALAAMLIYTGARLAAPSELAHARAIGSDQLLLFTTTLVVTLASDLLVGVAVGLLLKVVLHVARGTRLAIIFRPQVVVTESEGELRLDVQEAATFATLLAIRRATAKRSPEVRRVVIDVGSANLVDHTFLSRLEGMADQVKPAELEIRGMESLRPVSDHPLATRRR